MAVGSRYKTGPRPADTYHLLTLINTNTKNIMAAILSGLTNSYNIALGQCAAALAVLYQRSNASNSRRE